MAVTEMVRRGSSSIVQSLGPLKVPFVRASYHSNVAALRGSLVIAAHHHRQAQTKAGKLEWAKEMALHTSALFPFARIEHVLPNRKHRHLHADLMDNLFLHPVDSVGELIMKRLGEPGTSKDCQAFYIPGVIQPHFALSAVFRTHVEVPVDLEQEGHPLYSNALPSNVDVIKDADPLPLTGKENATGHYELISNTQTRGASDEFVKRGLADTGGKTKFTVSPARLIEKFYARNTLLDINDLDGPDAVRSLVVEYLKKQKDPAGNIHMRNGAFPTWIGVNPDSPKDPIIVNYVYDPDLLEENAAIYAAGLIPMGCALHNVLGTPQGTEPVSSSLISPRLMP